MSCVSTAALSVNLHKTMLFSSENQAFSSGKWPQKRFPSRKGRNVLVILN